MRALPGWTAKGGWDVFQYPKEAANNPGLVARFSRQFGQERKQDRARTGAEIGHAQRPLPLVAIKRPAVDRKQTV